MPEYKLYYFNARSRGEPIRLCFAAGGIKYEDVRFGQEWAAKKKEPGFSPLGYLPLLEVDGKKLNESLAILRYVAREGGLSPSDSFETAQCDMIVDSVDDITYPKMQAFISPFADEETKKPAKAVFFGTHLPSFLDKMTALLKNNNRGQGYFVGSKVTYADISMFHFCDTFTRHHDTFLDKYPDIKAHYKRVSEADGIKEYLKNRPDTQF